MRRRVKKRNGEVVEFDKNKLLSTIIKAFMIANPTRGQAIAIDTARFVYHASILPWVKMQKEKQMPWDRLRIVVENALMQHCPDVAKLYIIYGYEKDVLNGRERIVVEQEKI